MDLDIFRMIAEISERPELWDNATDIYKDKNKKREGWTHVCMNIIDDFEEKSSSERATIERQIIAKWRSVRDGYVKWKKRKKGLQGSALKKLHHKYIYADSMKFLNKCLQQAQKKEDAAAAASAITNNTPESNGTADQNNTPAQITPRESGKKKEKEVPEIEKEISNYLQKATELLESRRIENEEDEDMSFFKSMLPTVRKLDQAQKFHFRFQLMNTLQMLSGAPYQSATPFYQQPASAPVLNSVSQIQDVKPDPSSSQTEAFSMLPSNFSPTATHSSGSIISDGESEDVDEF